ncbi:hypothetical protein M3J09_005008 [Ascochyta lentis]
MLSRTLAVLILRNSKLKAFRNPLILRGVRSPLNRVVR